MTKIGIIGGTGLEDLEFIENKKEADIETPFGNPSSHIITGEYAGFDIIHLSRHGIEHTIPSSQINFRANMFAFKHLECSHIIATSACGSLQEEICPGEFIVFDQFIDFSQHRSSTIYEDFQPGEFRYTPMTNPFSEDIRNSIIEAAVRKGFTIHTKGTVITIDGPRFSTRAESNLFKSWGADAVNMTTAPEASLSNEIGIQYAVIALCSDYDSWRTDIKSPSFAEIGEVIDENVQNLIHILELTIKKLQE